mmetsp:Transcript_6864/g.16144  ORF Transcript_6864/g.16144 Transcript_6864/m.16144 type:complete len:185 (-) Transcript_6864:75-629(-)
MRNTLRTAATARHGSSAPWLGVGVNTHTHGQNKADEGGAAARSGSLRAAGAGTHRKTMKPSFMQLVVCARRIICRTMLSLCCVCCVDDSSVCLVLSRVSRCEPSMLRMLLPNEIERSARRGCRPCRRRACVVPRVREPRLRDLFLGLLPFVATVSARRAHPLGAAIVIGCPGCMGAAAEGKLDV